MHALNKYMADRYRSLVTQYGQKNVAQGTLKSITSINTTLSEFSFNIKENVGTTLAGEVRLALKDLFVITHVGFKISNVALDGSVGQAVPVTFPNPVKLTRAVAGALEAVYNGEMSIKVGNVEYIDDLDMQRFRFASNAQAGTLAGASLGSGSGTIEAIGVDGSAFGAGFIQQFPLITIDGQQSIDWKVTLSESTNLSGANESTNYAHLYLQGFKVTRS